MDPGGMPGREQADKLDVAQRYAILVIGNGDVNPHGREVHAVPDGRGPQIVAPGQNLRATLVGDHLEPEPRPKTGHPP